MQIDGNTFLVTGGSGFIGSHVVDQLIAQAAAEVVLFDTELRQENLASALSSGRVRFVEGDLTDRESVRGAVDGTAGVFHMAVLPLGPCIQDPRHCLEVNVVG